MAIFTEKTEDFLNNHIHPMKRGLAVAVIDQLGGEDAFIGNYRKNGSCGFTISEPLDNLKFYDDNKDDIKAYCEAVSCEYHVASMIELVASFKGVSETYNIDQVSKGISDSTAPHHNFLIGNIVSFIGNDLAIYYDVFLEADDEFEDYDDE